MFENFHNELLGKENRVSENKKSSERKQRFLISYYSFLSSVFFIAKINFI
jgi:hypothetical protein